MATIVDTLFGVSPERLQQQRAEAADARALEFAKLDPFQQANFAIGRGASSLAGALGGALGGRDPELQRATMRQQLLGTIDPNRPETFDLAAQAAEQAGDTQLAFGLRLEAPKYREQARLAQDQAQARQAKLLAQQQRTKAEEIARGAFIPGEPTLYGKPTPFPTVDEEGNAMPGAGMTQPSFDINKVQSQLLAMGPEGLAKLKELQEAASATRPEYKEVGGVLYEIPKFGKGKPTPVSETARKTITIGNRVLDATTMDVLYTAPDATPSAIAEWRTFQGMSKDDQKSFLNLQDLKRPPATNIKVSTGVQTGFGKSFEDSVNAARRAGRTAITTLGTIQNMQGLLDEGVLTGFGQESILQLNRAGQLLDPDFKIKGVAGQEAFQSFATGIILPQVKQLGVNPTDADLKFISSGSPGLSKTVEGNKLLLSALNLKLKREIDLAKFSNQFLAKNEKLVTENPLRASILFDEAFDQYTQTSPLYGPAASSLRERFNAIGAARSTNPAARSTLERGGLVNPQ